MYKQTLWNFLIPSTLRCTSSWDRQNGVMWPRFVRAASAFCQLHAKVICAVFFYVWFIDLTPCLKLTIFLHWFQQLTGGYSLQLGSYYPLQPKFVVTLLWKGLKCPASRNYNWNSDFVAEKLRNISKFRFMFMRVGRNLLSAVASFGARKIWRQRKLSWVLYIYMGDINQLLVQTFSFKVLIVKFWRIVTT